MFNSQSRKTLLLLGSFTFTSASTLNCYPLSKSFSISSYSDPHSFVVSYLVNNLGFSPQSALKASFYLRFDNPQQPDSVISFFRSLGLSNPQIHDIVRRGPRLLSCDSQKVILPKIEFLRSKGASTSDIVRMVRVTPHFLHRSLENHIIPTYEFLKGFLHSDKQIIDCLRRYSVILYDGHTTHNIKLLLDNGLTHSNIAFLLRQWPSVLCSGGMLQTVEELKGMGFNSSTTTFAIALMAKRSVSKAKWAAKVETFEKWGWSQEQVLQVFKKQPNCMLISTHKIDAIFSFWVNQLGLKSVDLVKNPKIFSLSLEKRIIPRASVLQFLISKGLRKKDESMCTIFVLSEKLFLEMLVKRFKVDSSHLLKLYEEKLNLASCK